MSWRQQLEEITSLGDAHQGVSRLADLAKARSEHLGQFFTPLAVVRLVWTLVEQACAAHPGETFSILDSSVGSGRLLHYATPDRFRLYGLDVHQPVVDALQAAAEAAGFECEFVRSPMEEAAPSGFHFALINPPFSLNLQSEHMQPLACTRWGRFGPNTGATSDEYALAQALEAAQVVIAILPSTTIDVLLKQPEQLVGDEHAKRLRGVLDLGGKAFVDEGAQVSTAIAVFGPDISDATPQRITVGDAQSFEVPPMDLWLHKPRASAPKLRIAVHGDSEPAVTMPVSGNRTVRVVHSGRKIHLKMACGLMYAKVWNAVLRERIFSTLEHRLPAGVRYSGQGVLDVEALVASQDFEATWNGFLGCMRAQGADVQVDPGLQNHLRRRKREAKRLATPFGRTIFAATAADQVAATAKVNVALDPASWVTPVVKQGEQIELRRVGGNWQFEKAGKSRCLTPDEALASFDFESAEAGWMEIAPPLQRVFPEIGQSLRAQALAAGIDRFLNWEFQFEDAIEMCIRPGGAICAWKQGLGKARLAAALPLLLKVRHALVAMPAYLLDEFPDRLRAAGIGEDMWQIIESPQQARSLRVINVISFERLRMRLPGTKRTYAHLLRHRVSLLLADEGEVLANPDSDQSRAIATVAAKRTVVLTGTPIPNLPRNALQIAVATAGDGVVGQPYGIRHPLLLERNARSMQFAERGVTAFADAFVSTAWVTNQFAETLTEGAKREIPKIANLAQYRTWLQPFMKRRLPEEPDVAKFVKIPVPTRETFEIEWDRSHLAYYLRIADEFCEWWLQQREQRKGRNLVALLARIGAVEQACNAPQLGEKGGPSHYEGGVTSKQRWVISRCVELSRTRKLVVYAKSPALLELYSRELNRCGTSNVLYHGEMDRRERRREVQEFRYGSTQVLLASFGVTRAGLDLYQSEHAIFSSRCWADSQEDQALRRLLRPQQTRPVTLDVPHLKGSIDVYQDQLVRWKCIAAAAGLDWAAPIGEDEEFLHLDTVLGRFVEDLAQLHGFAKSWEFREHLKEAA